MCGRYASATGRAELLSAFDATEDSQAAGGSAEPDFNVAPTKPVPVVVTRPRAGGTVRLLRTMRWGLVPSWAKDPSIGARLINARIESVAIKPAFRAAASRRRCLLPADGYYEWQLGSLGAPAGRKAVKQPWFIHPVDGTPMAMAGLWEVWRDPAGTPLLTATVITGDATDELGHLHDRSPMLVAPADWASWLDPAQTDAGVALALAGPPVPGSLVAIPVSTAVNNVRNNGPELCEPVELPGPTSVLF